jgi:cytochrome P450
MEALFNGRLTPALLQQATADFNAIRKGAFRRMFTPSWMNWIPTAAGSRYRRASVRLRQVVNDIIAERQETGIDHGDLLSALLGTRDTADGRTSGSASLAELEISDQVITFLLAGADTTAGLMIWALHLLALHPAIDKRLHAEVDATLAGSPACYEHLPELKFTRQVLAESLRLYPPGWIFSRFTETETHLGSYLVPAGSNVIYSPYLIHRRNDLYENPERFDPDRWDPTIASQPARYAFIPFGYGPRKCIGEQFALVEAALALATITARWRLESVASRPFKSGRSATLTTRGLWLRAISRHEAALNGEQHDNLCVPWEK